MANASVDYSRNLEIGIPIKLRDWLTSVREESKRKFQKIKDIKKDKIDLKGIIGQSQDLILDKITKWGEFYEGIKDDEEWNSEVNLPLIEIDALSPTSAMGEEEVSSRVLDIFQGILSFSDKRWAYS